MNRTNLLIFMLQVGSDVHSVFWIKQ